MNVPLNLLANNQLKSADRADPTWRYPDGAGAKRTRGDSKAKGPLTFLEASWVNKDSPI